MQCGLGVHVTLEQNSSCDGNLVIADLGSTCMSVSTQRAKGKIVDGNFTPGSTVPGPMPGPDANDFSGAPLACATVDGGTVTGLTAVGAANVFGSTLGDLTFNLTAVCQ
jgi:hypothetical protein